MHTSLRRLRGLPTLNDSINSDTNDPILTGTLGFSEDMECEKAHSSAEPNQFTVSGNMVAVKYQNQRLFYGASVIKTDRYDDTILRSARPSYGKRQS